MLDVLGGMCNGLGENYLAVSCLQRYDGCMPKSPKELSPGEELFAFHLKQYGILFEREVEFCAGRKWRFDFLIQHPDCQLAIEIEGGTEFGKSRHSAGDGFEADARKYNTAALMGYTVLRFSTAMVKSAEAIDCIRELFV
jgi:hypothetical protein